MITKLRDTLVKIQETIDRTLSILNEIPENNSHNGLVEDAVDALCVIKETYIPEALSGTLRNCDVGTITEQKERFDKYCLSRKCYKCPVYFQNQKSVDCSLWWGQMLYEEVK